MAGKAGSSEQRKTIFIAEKIIFATRQQAAGSTSSTTRRSNAVAEIKFFR
jgi:hypothetical protein